MDVRRIVRHLTTSGMIAVAVGGLATNSPRLALAACQAGAEATAITYTDARGVTTTTTANYMGVAGLVQTVEEDSSGRMEGLSTPTWLQDAYGGNLAAMQYDLERGLLRDRGPCR